MNPLDYSLRQLDQLVCGAFTPFAWVTFHTVSLWTKRPVTLDQFNPFMKRQKPPPIISKANKNFHLLKDVFIGRG